MKKKIAIVGILILAILLLLTACTDEVTVTGITLSENYPAQLLGGEPLDLSAVQIILAKSDGSTEAVPITEGDVSYGGFDSETPGDYTVIVRYGEFMSSFTVTVAARVDTLSLTAPTKTSYVYDESLSLVGLSLTVKRSYGESIVLTSEDYTLSNGGFDSRKAGTYTVTLTVKPAAAESYGLVLKESAASFSVTVAARTVSGLSIVTLPSKTVYYSGESLSVDGLVVKKLYNYGDGVILEPSEYTVSSQDFDTTSAVNGAYTVTVTLDGTTVSTSFAVSYVAKFLTGIRIKTPADKLSYLYGEELDASGLVLEKLFNYGEPEEALPSEWEVACTAFDSCLDYDWQYTVTVLLKGTVFETDYEVAVTGRIQTGIDIATPATKLQFAFGDTFTYAGLTVQRIFDFGAPVLLSETEWTAACPQFNTTGMTGRDFTVTIDMDGSAFSAQYTVVYQTPVVTAISLSLIESGKFYLYGDTPSLSDFSLRRYVNGSAVLYSEIPLYEVSSEYGIRSAVTHETPLYTVGDVVFSIELLSDTSVTADIVLSVKMPKLKNLRLANTTSHKRNYQFGESFSADGLVLLADAVIDGGSAFQYTEGYSLDTDNFIMDEKGDKAIFVYYTYLYYGADGIEWEDTISFTFYVTLLPFTVTFAEIDSLSVPNSLSQWEEFPSGGIIGTKVIDGKSYPLRTSEISVDSSAFNGAVQGNYAIIVSIAAVSYDGAGARADYQKSTTFYVNVLRPEKNTRIDGIRFRSTELYTADGNEYIYYLNVDDTIEYGDIAVAPNASQSTVSLYYNGQLFHAQSPSLAYTKTTLTLTVRLSCDGYADREYSIVFKPYDGLSLKLGDTLYQNFTSANIIVYLLKGQGNVDLTFLHTSDRYSCVSSGNPLTTLSVGIGDSISFSVLYDDTVTVASFTITVAEDRPAITVNGAAADYQGEAQTYLYEINIDTSIHSIAVSMHNLSDFVIKKDGLTVTDNYLELYGYNQYEIYSGGTLIALLTVVRTVPFSLEQITADVGTLSVLGDGLSLLYNGWNSRAITLSLQGYVLSIFTTDGTAVSDLLDYVYRTGNIQYLIYAEKEGDGVRLPLLITVDWRDSDAILLEAFVNTVTATVNGNSILATLPVGTVEYRAELTLKTGYTYQQNGEAVTIYTSDGREVVRLTILVTNYEGQVDNNPQIQFIQFVAGNNRYDRDIYEPIAVVANGVLELYFNERYFDVSISNGVAFTKIDDIVRIAVTESLSDCTVNINGIDRYDLTFVLLPATDSTSLTLTLDGENLPITADVNIINVYSDDVYLYFARENPFADIYVDGVLQSASDLALTVTDTKIVVVRCVYGAMGTEYTLQFIRVFSITEYIDDIYYDLEYSGLETLRGGYLLTLEPGAVFQLASLIITARTGYTHSIVQEGERYLISILYGVTVIAEGHLDIAYAGIDDDVSLAAAALTVLGTFYEEIMVSSVGTNTVTMPLNGIFMLMLGNRYASLTLSSLIGWEQVDIFDTTVYMFHTVGQYDFTAAVQSSDGTADQIYYFSVTVTAPIAAEFTLEINGTTHFLVSSPSHPFGSFDWDDNNGTLTLSLAESDFTAVVGGHSAVTLAYLDEEDWIPFPTGEGISLSTSQTYMILVNGSANIELRFV